MVVPLNVHLLAPMFGLVECTEHQFRFLSDENHVSHKTMLNKRDFSFAPVCSSCPSRRFITLLDSAS